MSIYSCSVIYKRHWSSFTNSRQWFKHKALLKLCIQMLQTHVTMLQPTKDSLIFLTWICTNSANKFRTASDHMYKRWRPSYLRKCKENPLIECVTYLDHNLPMLWPDVLNIHETDTLLSSSIIVIIKIFNYNYNYTIEMYHFGFHGLYWLGLWWSATFTSFYFHTIAHMYARLIVSQLKGMQGI